MIPQVDDRKLVKELNNIVQYAEGFIDGANRAKPALMTDVAKHLKVLVGQYIDASARVNPAQLQHVYEWYKTGQAEARLFRTKYRIVNGSLLMTAYLTQSKSIKDGSTMPFRDKANVMENQIPVTISPKNSPVLAFDVDGKTVFTRKPVVVTNPGGDEASNGFEKAFREFFVSYLSQSLLFSSGMISKLKDPREFKANLKAGSKVGRGAGVSAGVAWMNRRTDY